jgi:predicted GIY-YIG superfamily endonuclease
MYYVYILLCADYSFYVGHTKELKKRIQNHKSGFGSSYTTNRIPVKLVYYEIKESKEAAINRGKQIKSWTRKKKINLIKFGHPKSGK